MNKKYQFSFIYHETEVLIDLDYGSYELALSKAKFHCEAFIEEVWRRASPNRNIQSTHEEYLKIASDFNLSPNIQNFNFSAYFETYYKFLEFSKDMENVWHGMRI